MLNTSLIDVATGERAFEITTELLPELARTPSPAGSEVFSGTSSVVLTPSAPSSSTSSVHWARQQRDSQSSNPKECPDLRRTRISDPSGKTLVDVMWKGRHPSITICGEKIGALTALFGSSSIRFMPKVLAIPTRFDTEYVWLATADSLCLFDYDTDTVQGSFHQNCIRLPTPLKSKSKSSSPTSSTSLKRKPSLATKLSLMSPSKFNVSSPPSSPIDDEPQSPKSPSSYTPKSTFIPTHFPGIGSNYLEFSSHPLAQDVEIILSFLMMEILRRGRFALTPYTFENPTSMWDARPSFLRGLRRNTV
ncbi:hypothetical protein EST38_g6223 [Candolleomyces aberdarensis]|uniref:Uncharacterized protein n=1 Tax=Candolleomyces aberdarensis TaxID=2316362 RepID=A0A4Q2DIB2_9AGAR|nr:hypothetical protein EST38_g6223 [Candolleomyces aberdarensis]